LSGGSSSSSSSESSSESSIRGMSLGNAAGPSSSSVQSLHLLLRFLACGNSCAVHSCGPAVGGGSRHSCGPAVIGGTNCRTKDSIIGFIRGVLFVCLNVLIKPSFGPTVPHRNINTDTKYRSELISSTIVR
jgi:hypothetical protein